MEVKDYSFPSAWGVPAVSRLLQSVKTGSRDMSDVLIVQFPGAYYMTERPLFYFLAMQALELGADVLNLSYGYQSLPGRMGLSDELRDRCVNDLPPLWEAVDLDRYKRVLFFSKSFGTLIASTAASSLRPDIFHLYLTPLNGTVHFMDNDKCCVVSGDKDPLFSEDSRMEVRRREVPFYELAGADHGLETGETMTSLEHLKTVVEIGKKCLTNGDESRRQ